MRRTIVPASALSARELAALMTAGYEGYRFPIVLDEAAFTHMGALVDADVDLSRVVSDGDRPVGIVLVARRGTEAWIGGMGVVPPERRKGHGRAGLVDALDAARANGVRRVRLEVLDDNAGAEALYASLGFVRSRRLDIWSLTDTSASRPPEVTDVPPVAAHGWILEHTAIEQPWQRDHGTVRAMLRLDEPLAGLAVHDGGGQVGAAVVRTAGRRVSIVQLAATTQDAARRLLVGAVAEREGLSWLNVPEDDDASVALEEFGGRRDASQFELVLALD